MTVTATVTTYRRYLQFWQWSVLSTFQDGCFRSVICKHQREYTATGKRTESTPTRFVRSSWWNLDVLNPMLMSYSANITRVNRNPCKNGNRLFVEVTALVQRLAARTQQTNLYHGKVNLQPNLSPRGSTRFSSIKPFVSSSRIYHSEEHWKVFGILNLCNLSLPDH